MTRARFIKRLDKLGNPLKYFGRGWSASERLSVDALGPGLERYLEFGEEAAKFTSREECAQCPKR